jgi:hypothetical protein
MLGQQAALPAYGRAAADGESLSSNPCAEIEVVEAEQIKCAEQESVRIGTIAT